MRRRSKKLGEPLRRGIDGERDRGGGERDALESLEFSLLKLRNHKIFHCTFSIYLHGNRNMFVTHLDELLDRLLPEELLLELRLLESSLLELVSLSDEYLNKEQIIS